MLILDAWFGNRTDRDLAAVGALALRSVLVRKAFAAMNPLVVGFAAVRALLVLRGHVIVQKARRSYSPPRP